ncbi:MAG: hypothetical protein R8J85_02635 [Mariprofundales bacterium]
MLTIRLFILLIFPIAIIGCNQEPPHPIQWQLPLTTALDPHQSPHDALPPDWATTQEGLIHLRLLATNSGKQYPLTIPMHGEASVQDIAISLTGLANGLRVHNGGLMFDDPKTTNPAAFIEIYRNQQPLFSGWIYRDFPEMFTPDIAGWKFFLDNATIRAALIKAQPQVTHP